MESLTTKRIRTYPVEMLTKGINSISARKLSKQSKNKLESADLSQSSLITKPRIALYSHDTMGLGHMRRNLLLAQTLAEPPLSANVLLIAGAREVGRFELPKGVDCIALPSYVKNIDGSYQPRYLDMETKNFVSLRSQTILSTIKSFSPQLLIVDNVPTGAMTELLPTLSYLKKLKNVQCILGLRDILDTKEQVQKEWQSRNYENVIRKFYHKIFIYGDREIFDTCKEYEIPQDISAIASYTGYLDGSTRAIPTDVECVEIDQAAQNLPKDYCLCMVGGGQDGYRLAKTFAKAIQRSKKQGVLITGPYMDQNQIYRLKRYANEYKGLRIAGFVCEPSYLIAHATCVITMGGYNTLSEVLTHKKKTLVVPRIKPRHEQLIRAKTFERIGAVDYMQPDTLKSKAVSAWINNNFDHSRVGKLILNFDGLDNLYIEVSKMLVNTHVTERYTQ